jgi:hypothetical protein
MVRGVRMAGAAEPRPETSSETSKISTTLETLRASLDIVKALAIIAVLGAGLLLFFDNRNEFKELFSLMQKVEFAGLKAEFARRNLNEYDARRASLMKGKAFLKPEHHKALYLRASYLAPILADAQILWVDDNPEANNPEIAFLTERLVRIRLARTNDQAMDELGSGRIDLVISDVGRKGEALPDGARLARCRVHWFAVPESVERKEGLVNEPQDSEKRKTLLAHWNDQQNKEPQIGFHLAERMVAELGGPITSSWGGSGSWANVAIKDDKIDREIVESIPPIIFYSQYDQRVANACSDTITSDAYTLLHSVFDHLEKRR